MQICLLGVVLLSLPSVLQAQFTFITNNGAITITGYTGNPTVLNIPATTNGYPVISIGNSAFYNKSSLTNATIPNSITNIGVQAFSSCTSLTAITVDANNQAYSSVAGGLFNKSTNTLIQYPGGQGGSYTVPTSVTNIGNYAFYYCTRLGSVTIPFGVISIGSDAFESCSSLTSVIIPNSVGNIGSYAFYYCTSLTSITIPNSVTIIGYWAFINCTSLTAITVDTSNPAFSSVAGVLFNKGTNTLILYPGGQGGSYTVPNSVTNIGDSAFYRCIYLTNATIPPTVISIPNGPFFNCPSLATITVDSSNPVYTSVAGVLFNKSTNSLIQYPGGKGGSYAVPNSVTKIESFAFAWCSGLTNVTIPSSVTSIGMSAFVVCSSLTSVTIGNNVTNIGTYAFGVCTSLKSVYFQGNAPSGGSDSSVFSSDNNLTVYYLAGTTGWGTTYGGRPTALWNTGVPYNVAVANGTITIIGYTGSGGAANIPSTIIGLPVTSIGSYAFYSCTNLTHITIPNTVTNIGNYAFGLCAGLTNLTIGTNLMNIGSYAFYYCSNLTAVTLPNSVNNVAEGAFRQCTSLTNITMSTNVINIGSLAFYSCSNLTSITIPNSVISIGSQAFDLCNNLTNVAIPAGVSSIGAGAFAWCANLTNITVAAPNAFYCSVAGVLFDKNQTTLLQFPAGKAGSYVISNSVTSIGSYAFEGCSGLTSVTIPNSVTSIEDQAFYLCVGLTSIFIPNSVTNIGTAAFGACSNLPAITLETPNYFYTVVDGVLFNQDQTLLLQFPAGKGGNYLIPNTVTNIAGYAFSRCPSLVSVTIPNGVNSITNYTFYYCTNLTAIYFKGNAPSLDWPVFTGDSKATVYYLPGTTGWSNFSSNSGLPTVLWNPQAQTRDVSFGVRTNRFAFTIAGSNNLVIVVEACTGLNNPVWSPLSTNTLNTFIGTNGTSYFSDPQWTNYSGRFYRIRSP